MTRTDPGLSPTLARARQARLAVFAYFGVLGVTNGDWLARIPALAHGLHLSDGMLGLVLLAMPAGSFAVASPAGWVADRAGSRGPTLLGGLAVALIPITFGLAGSQVTLMAAMLAFGVAAGVLDVSMNAQAVHLQTAARRSLMTSFHACYSFGALAGGLIGGAFAWAGTGTTADFTAVAIPLAVVAAVSGRTLLRSGELVTGRDVAAPEASGSAGQPGAGQPGGGQLGTGQPDAGQPRAGQPGGGQLGTGQPDAGQPGGGQPGTGPRGSGAEAGRAMNQSRRPASLPPLLVLSLLALCSLLGEGAADGWSAVYMHDNLGTSAWLAALGYSAFALTMAAGRLAGDRLADRVGPAALLRIGGLLAAAGLAAVLITANPAGAIIGFAIYGAGLSCTFPQMLAVAGRIRPDRPASAIGRVAGMGYAGLLAGPVMIGGLASAAGLTAALGLPALLALAIAGGAGLAVPPRAGVR